MRIILSLYPLLSLVYSQASQQDVNTAFGQPAVPNAHHRPVFSNAIDSPPSLQSFSRDSATPSLQQISSLLSGGNFGGASNGLLGQAASGLLSGAGGGAGGLGSQLSSLFSGQKPNPVSSLLGTFGGGNSVKPSQFGASPFQQLLGGAQGSKFFEGAKNVAQLIDEGINGIQGTPFKGGNSVKQEQAIIDPLAGRLGPARIDLQGITSGSLPGLAPIPVPGFPGPQDIPRIPGVNTIPGLDMFNYLIGQLVPQAVSPANALLQGSVNRLFPQESTKNLAKDVFRSLHPPAAEIVVDQMMGRWFQVINSPHVIREACTVSHFGALTNNTYSATFTILKFYREGNPNGPPRFSLGYGFKGGPRGQFVLHSSNSPDSEPFWVVKTGPLNKFGQYEYAIISNWIKFPVFVIARDAEKFQKVHLRSVLEFLEQNNYINFLTKAFNMIAPVEYSQCQYTPTFSAAG